MNDCRPRQWDRIRLTGFSGPPLSDAKTLLNDIIYPPAVAPGARVGVAALSGKIDPERLDRGIAALEEIGFDVVPASNLGRRWLHFAGGDDERLLAFHELADRRDLDAIFFARGGHGVLRLLSKIDWSRLAERPRYYIGYSDLTPLLNQIVVRLGWVALHGPMVAADLARGLSPPELESLLGTLRGEPPEIGGTNFDGFDGPLSGTLVGGCLSLLTSTLGTPFQQRFEQKILFLEDVNEPAYRLDRMLTQLKLSGTLAPLRAMILGDLQATDSESEDDSRQTIRTALGDSTPPLVSGVCCGHGSPNLTLPLGATVRLEPSTARVSFEVSP